MFPNVEAFDIYPDESDQGLTNLLMIASSQAPSHEEWPGRERAFIFDSNAPVITDNWNPGDVWSINAADHWHHTIRTWLGNAALIPI